MKNHTLNKKKFFKLLVTARSNGVFGWGLLILCFVLNWKLGIAFVMFMYSTVAAALFFLDQFKNEVWEKKNNLDDFIIS